MSTLVLGCGSKRYPGAVHVDYRRAAKPDVLWDVNEYPWPLHREYTTILAEHILEHTIDRIAFLRECRSHAATNAVLVVEVPHWKHHYAHGHLEHRWTFAHNSFDAIDTLDMPWRCVAKACRIGTTGILLHGNTVTNVLSKWTPLVSGLRFTLVAV